MNIDESLAHEWTTLQNNHERYEMGGLLIKLASVALTVAGFGLHLNLALVFSLVALLWAQEGIYRTFQARLGRRILQVEGLVKLAATGKVAATDDVAFQLHSDWLANRPRFFGLVGEYARSACRPTVAFPYVVLLLGLAIVRLR